MTAELREMCKFMAWFDHLNSKYIINNFHMAVNVDYELINPLWNGQTAMLARHLPNFITTDKLLTPITRQAIWRDFGTDMNLVVYLNGSHRNVDLWKYDSISSGNRTL